METAATVLAAQAGQSTSPGVSAAPGTAQTSGALARLKNLSSQQLLFLGGVMIALLALLLAGGLGSRMVYQGPNRRRTAHSKEKE